MNYVGNFFQLPEPDLSHFQYQHNINIIDIDVWAENTAGKKSGYTAQSSILLWGLFASLVIHSALLSSNFSSSFISAKRQIASLPPQPIHIELQQAKPNAILHTEMINPEIAEPEIAAEIVEPALVESALVEQSHVVPIFEHKNDNGKINNGEQNVSLDKADKQSIFIPVTPEELRSLQDEPVYSLEPSDADLEKVSSQPFGSVFDPRLRKKLQDQQLARRARETGLSVYELSNGASVVKLSDNHCLSTLSGGKKENATNWYHSSCREKTEGEQIMDRVNKSLK